MEGSGRSGLADIKVSVALGPYNLHGLDLLISLTGRIYMCN